MYDRKLTQDIIALFIISIGNSLYFYWPVIYPFLASYLKESNHDLELKQFFSACPAIFLGIIISNMILPKFYFLFGIKNTMILGGFLILLNGISFYTFSSLFMIIFNFGWLGINYQIFILSTSYYLSEKYQNGAIYSGYAYGGQNVGMILWPFLVNIIINPQNENLIIDQKNGNHFSSAVSNRIPNYMLIYGGISCLIIIIGAILLNDPPQFQFNFFNWLKALKNKDEKSLKQFNQSYIEMKNKINTSMTQSISQMSMRSTEKVNYQVEVELNDKEEKLVENKNQEENQEIERIEANKIMWSPKFIGLILISSVKISSLIYFVDNYKYIALLTIKNDFASSTAFAFSAFTNLIGKLLAPTLWKKYGFLKCYQINLIGSLLNSLLLIVFVDMLPSIVLFLINFERIFLGFGYIISYMTVFDLYKPSLAIHLSKLYDCCYLIGVGYAVFLNYIIPIEIYFKKIFIIFALIDIFAIISLKLFYSNYEEQCNEKKNEINQI